MLAGQKNIHGSLSVIPYDTLRIWPKACWHPLLINLFEGVQLGSDLSFVQASQVLSHQTQ